MKVVVITRHSVFNYGSLLQTIAIQSAIESFGCECEIIDYQRIDEDYRKIASVLVERTSWNKNLALRFIYKLVQTPKFFIMGKHFEKLRKGMIKTTKTYVSIDELRENKPPADIYMTGSDQVWGPIGGDTYDPAYFLDFVSPDDVCVSYAASFGRIDLTDEVLHSVCNYLKKYSLLTVREKSAVQLIDKLGIGEAVWVLDPTLLFDSAYWNRISCNVVKEDYILIYQLHNNSQMLEYAYQLAEKEGLKLITMSSTVRHLVHRGSKHIVLPSLGEWLGYIQNARFMITDSFHGTAFAINFNTQFINILPEGTATRNQSILELTGLMDRVVTDYEDFSFFSRQIDYVKVNDLIQQKREESLEVLKQMLAIRK